MKQEFKICPESKNKEEWKICTVKAHLMGCKVIGFFYDECYDSKVWGFLFLNKGICFKKYSK